MMELGPLDENEAINGAGFVPNCVLTWVRYAMGFLFVVPTKRFNVDNINSKT